MQAPMLTASELGEDLFMYLSVSRHVMNAVLLRDQVVQQPVYYINKTLVDAETRYLPPEKVGVSTSARYEKAATLFSSSHCLCVNRVSLTIIVKEIRLHRPNS